MTKSVSGKKTNAWSHDEDGAAAKAPRSQLQCEICKKTPEDSC